MIHARDFAFYDEKNKEWVVEADEFVLQSAASSADIKSATTIKIANKFTYN
ncbi:MAG: hypothetical protein LUG18_14410 [Candidatus Azobacteroides sp.]|nr:hypothetical protein [Candidatus Azobacteroides sp.]